MRHLKLLAHHSPFVTDRTLLRVTGLAKVLAKSETSACNATVVNRYNGKLAFTIGHYFFNTEDRKAINHTGDIILESFCDWTLKVNVFKPYKTNSFRRLV